MGGAAAGAVITMAPSFQTACLFGGILLAGIASSAPLNSTTVTAFAQSLAGTVLPYTVSSEAPAIQLPTFDLWSYLEDGPNPYVKFSQPALYVIAQDVNDIVESLKFAAENSLKTAIMGAGHQVVGVQLLPNSLTIDTSNLTAIEVDPDTETAYVQAGTTGEELIAAVEVYNLMWPTGHVGSVGVAGVALGGGEGIGGSLWGASVDSVLGIDVVSTWQNNTADWDIVRINATNEPDLFWGMLGGGAMLATALGFELQLHPLPVDGILTGVTVIWPLPLGVEAFQMYNDWLADAPEELSTGMALATTPKGQVATVSITNWDPYNSTGVTEAIEAFEAGASETGAIAVAPSAYTLSEYLASYTAQLPSGPTAYYINDRFLLSVPEALVESLVGLYANATSPHAVLLIQPGSRSVGVNNNSDTAFGYRDAWNVWVWPFWLRSDGGAAVDGDAEHIAWAAQGGDILDLYGEGHYINMNRFDTADSTETCFPPANWARLQEVKAKYDPHNLFRPLDYFRTDDGFSGLAGDSDY